MSPAALSNPASNVAIAESDLTDGLDRITLTQTRQRFTTLNKQRLDRLRASLLPQQQLFLDVLPILFHVNHPSLPGYVGNASPAGIENFQLSHLHIKSARKISNSFALQRELNPELEIAGLYFMGSCSSLTHHRKSDLDIWVAIRDHFSDEKQAALRKKCTLISEWAASLRLEAHFFIMEEDAFKQRDRAAMSEEDCGSTQHFLLLDEFYRTSIVFAGCTPMWWYVPASQEDQYEAYVSTLIEKRYIKPDSVIDYGSPGIIPPTEFVTAGLWQLYKGISQPDKSLLKLLLLEVYASEYPDTQNLCQQFKSTLYASDEDRDNFDPYLQVYRRIETYLLERGENDRLELLRRCLYIKANLKLSQVPGDDSPEQFIAAGSDRHWKWHLMYQLVREWGWRRDKLRELDDAKNRRINQVRSMQTALTRELTRSYHFIGKLLKAEKATATDGSAVGQRILEANQVELNLIGRQLYAAFENKPNKLPQVTQSLSHSLVEERLVFSCHTTDSDSDNTSDEAQNDATNRLWSLLVEDNTKDSETDTLELKKSTDPVQLLVWAMINGLVDANTRFKVEGDNVDLTDYELKQLATSMRRLLPERNFVNCKAINKQRFSKPAQLDNCLFIVNAGVDPLKSHKLADMWRVSSKTDPLAYSAIAENLVVSISIVTVNSWGEVYSYAFEGDTAVNDALTHYFSLRRANGERAQPDRHFFCASSTRPIAIVNRLSKLFDDINDCVASTDSSRENARQDAACTYLFESALGTHALYWNQQQPTVALYEDTQSLLTSLSERGDTGAVHIDHAALVDHPLALVVRTLEARDSAANQHEAKTPAIFYELIDKTAKIYLADHVGAVAYTEITFDSVRSLITPIQHFVVAHYQRNFHHERYQEQQYELHSDHHQDGINLGGLNPLSKATILTEVSCYTMQKTNGRYIAVQLPSSGELNAPLFSIKANAVRAPKGDLRWTIDCMGELFEEAVLGDQLFVDVARAILRYRKPSQQHYRCYITDIEIDDASSAPSLTRDFNYKNQLERALNGAFQQLL